MRRILLFQHVAHENWGTLPQVLKEKKFRVRYVNFERHPEATPIIENYNGLIVMGGHMSVYESSLYPHVNRELKLIEKALQLNLPILGICLGAQLLATVLGAKVEKCKVPEVGWHDIHLSSNGRTDPLFQSFGPTEKVFQMHGDYFDLPDGAQALASSPHCQYQAFRFGQSAYGLQFHIEVNRPMIDRWIKRSSQSTELLKGHDEDVKNNIRQKILQETESCLGRSMQLGLDLFQNFLSPFGEGSGSELLTSDHGKGNRS